MTQKLKIKRLKKKFQFIANQEKAGKATSVSQKMYFKAKSSFRRNFQPFHADI